MLNKISRLLFGKKDEEKQADRPKAELSRRPEKTSQRYGSKAVESFLFSISGHMSSISARNLLRMALSLNAMAFIVL